MCGGAGPSKKPRLTVDLETVESQLQLCRNVRGKPSLSREEKLDILFVYFSIYRDTLKNETENTPIDAVSRTSSLLGLGKGTVSSVIKEWREKNDDENADDPELKIFVSSTNRPGNTKTHFCNIPSGQIVYIAVRDFV